MTVAQRFDAHLHLWDPTRLRYPWLDGVPSLRRAYHANDYAPFADGSCRGALFVEANVDPLDADDELALFAEAAAQEPRLTGMVAYVNLRDVGQREARLRTLSARDDVVGVRQNVQGEPPAFYRDPRFAEGIDLVGGNGLTFDLCATADQLDDLHDLVASRTATRIIIDHCGKPDIAGDEYAAWARDLARLAALDNTYCKISGLLAQSRPDQRTAEALAPWIMHAAEAFGPDRICYGSDWPVVELAGGMELWKGIIDDVTAIWSIERREAFYLSNAMHIYGVRHDVRR